MLRSLYRNGTNRSFIWSMILLVMQRKKKENDSIPSYLALTNESFQHFVQHLVDTINTNRIQDVQNIALCLHRLAAVHIQKQVTSIYFKSGTGTLRDPEPELEPVNRRVWPMQVKSAMLKQHAANPSATYSDSRK